MKTKSFFAYVVCLLTVLSLVGCAGAPGETVPPEQTIQLGKLSLTVTLPTDQGFEVRESELNDFFGVSASGEWCIIANAEEKDGYLVEEYAQVTAEANGAAGANLDENGNYYFTYTSKEADYRFYTAVREDADNFYRVAFYCPVDVWESYKDRFIQWAATIQQI